MRQASTSALDATHILVRGDRSPALSSNISILLTTQAGLYVHDATPAYIGAAAEKPPALVDRRGYLLLGSSALMNGESSPRSQSAPNPLGQFQVVPNPSTVPAPPNNTVLRPFLAERSGRPAFPMADAVRLVVPLCVQAADLHRQGYGVYLHPSNIAFQQGVLVLISERAATPPTLAADVACMPPEFRPDRLGDARTSVYSIGAILYELVTGQSAGRDMRRPSKLVPGLPHSFEVLLANALIATPEHRPSDLNALAEALYNLAPRPSATPPPKADQRRVSLLAIDVDVSLSMLPPDEDPRAGGAMAGAAAMNIPKVPPIPHGLNLPVMAAPPSSQGFPSGPRSGVLPGPASHGLPPSQPMPSSGGDAATAELAAVKARLSADPSPRYVVVKNGMDHGPFSGMELLQQLGAHTFSLEDSLVDQQTQQERLIQDWPEFAPFAEHAKRHRELEAERVAVDVGVQAEKKKSQGKALLGLLLLGGLIAGAGVWLVARTGTRSDEVQVQTETIANVEAEGDVASKKKGSAGGKQSRVVGSQGGIPILSGGQSCEGARAAYVEEITMKGGQPDITRGQYANILNSGAYFGHCGVPSSVAINICAAVQNGRAVGVTVSTQPSHGSRRCIANAVRKLSFPSHPKLDVVRVNFSAQ